MTAPGGAAPVGARSRAMPASSGSRPRPLPRDCRCLRGSALARDAGAARFRGDRGPGRSHGTTVASVGARSRAMPAQCGFRGDCGQGRSHGTAVASVGARSRAMPAQSGFAGIAGKAAPTGLPLPLCERARARCRRSPVRRNRGQGRSHGTAVASVGARSRAMPAQSGFAGIAAKAAPTRLPLRLWERARARCRRSAVSRESRPRPLPRDCRCLRGSALARDAGAVRFSRGSRPRPLPRDRRCLRGSALARDASAVRSPESQPRLLPRDCRCLRGSALARDARDSAPAA